MPITAGAENTVVSPMFRLSDWPGHDEKTIQTRS